MNLESCRRQINIEETVETSYKERNCLYLAFSINCIIIVIT